MLGSWALLFNRLLVLSLNSAFARSRGINTFWVESFFAAILAVVVAISIQWVGILIINALLVLPAAAARNVTNNVKAYQLLSVLIALGAGLMGLLFAYYCNMDAGATIVVISALIFFVTLALKSRFRR